MTAGNIQQIADPTDRTTRFYYDQFNRVVAQVVNFNNRVQDFSPSDASTDLITKYYYDDSGNLEAVVDSKARLTWMCYDGLNRNTRTITNFYVNSSINIIFDFANNADYYNEIGYGTTQADLRDIACGLTATTANSAPDTNIITDVSYDNLGRPTIITYWNFDTPYHTHIFYDGLSRITQTIENYDNGIADVADVDKDIITQYTYDRLGNLITVVTPNNLTTLYQYDALNRQTGVIYNYVNGGAVDSDTNITETITYDVLGRVRQTQNAEGIITTFNYDNADRLISYTNTVDSFIISTNYLYDVGGRLVRMANPLGNSTIYTYDQMNRQTSTISPSGFVSRFEYDYAGRVQRQIDAGNRATSYQYDALNRVTGVVENSENSASVLNDGSIQTLYEYDVVGNLLQVTAPSNAVITYTYDRLDRPIGYDGLGSALTSWQTDYDQFGRILAITAPDTTQTTYSYDNLHRLTGVNYASAPDVSYVYDRLGRRTSMDDGVGTTTYAYDDMNRITNVATPNTSVGYAYDRLGRRIQLTMDNDTTVTGGEKSISYAYDAINRLKSVTGWDGANHITEYQYDIASRLTKMVLPNRVSAQYEYDADNRLVALAYLKPQSLETDVYVYEYNNVGMRTASNETTYNLITSLIPNRELRDELARLVAEDETGDILYVMPSSTACGDDCFRVDVVAMVRPDNNAQATPVEVSDYVDFKLTYTNPQEANTTVEGQGLTVQALPRQFTSSATDENFSKLVYERIAPMVYRAYDNVLTLIFGDNYTPQIILEENFELFMALLGTGQSTQTSQITQRIEYTYDGMYRLREAVYKLNGETTQTYTYGYDVLGSRTSETITIPSETPVTRAFNYNNSGQIDQTGFDYDTKGNLVTDGVYTYNYDDANRLISIGDSTNTNTLSTYTYNGDGDRVSQTSGANTTHYMLDVNSRLTQVLGEFQAGDETWYLHGLDIIGQQNSADGWAYFGYDALGSVRTIYDDTGALAYVNDYDPYGQVIRSEAVGNSTVTSSLGFAGEQTDDSGLVYLRARYMNPETGAFLSTDPIHGMVGMSMTWNPYPYALGNPVHYTDPSGESPLLWALGIGVFLGTLSALNNLSNQLNDPLCRDPLDCVDWNDISNSWWEGFTFGFGGTLLAWGMVFGSLPIKFASIGALLTTLESIDKQTREIIDRGLASGFIDALDFVDWGTVAFDAAVGAVGGIVLSLGGPAGSITRVIGDAARLSTTFYVMGNIGAFFIGGVPISPKNIAINAIASGLLGFVDNSIQSDVSRFSRPLRWATYGLTGLATAIGFHVLTDENPFENAGETLIVGIAGALNIPSSGKGMQPITDRFSGVGNILTNFMSTLTDTSSD